MAAFKKTYCRICNAFCAADVAIENGRVVQVRGDKADPETKGYLCAKGVQNVELLYGASRLLHPLERGASGSFSQTSLAAAFEKIASKLKRIVETDGPRAVGLFFGTPAVFNVLTKPAALAFATALETPCVFDTMTIDQSAKWVANERIGVFNGGPQRFDQSDVFLLVGSNPLVSLQGGPPTSGFGNINPIKTLRDVKARGLKLIVVDPRMTETARQADLFLQIRPGEDATLLAGLIHVVLRENWHDAEFCRRYVDGVDRLRRAVSSFTPIVVAARTDIPADQIELAARMFAREARTGMVGTGTGPDMGPHSNVAEHLAQCLNVLCGRFLKEGDEIPNPGVLQPPQIRYADVSGPARSWETGPRSRRLGLGRLNGQMMSAELADEMLLPGPGRIRALICVGSNPAVCLPDQSKAIEGLRSLDLLVTIDPRMSGTARLAHFIIPPLLPFERHDHTGRLESQFARPYAHYAAPVVDPPSGSEVTDEWKALWEIARNMGLAMQLGGYTCTQDPTPSTESMLVGCARGSRVPLEVVRNREGGAIYDVGKATVQPQRADHADRLELAAEDVLEEIDAVAALKSDRNDGSFLMVVRRLREMMNSVLTDSPTSRARIPHNPAYLHPDDLLELGLAEGDTVTVTSSAGSITVLAVSDPTLKRGTVAIAHCWGVGVDDHTKIPESTSRLVASERGIQSINGMPTMTAIPVKIEKSATPLT